MLLWITLFLSPTLLFVKQIVWVSGVVNLFHPDESGWAVSDKKGNICKTINHWFVIKAKRIQMMTYSKHMYCVYIMCVFIIIFCQKMMQININTHCHVHSRAEQYLKISPVTCWECTCLFCVQTVIPLCSVISTHGWIQFSNTLGNPHTSTLYTKLSVHQGCLSR